MLDVLTAGNAGKETAAQNIEAVGTEFESVFLSMMIKEMRQTLDGGFFGEEGSDSYGGMFDMFVGKDLAQTRPLGIADMLLQQYEQQQQQQQSHGGESDASGATSAKPATSITA
jgi:Rod binding domain-containing protein